MVVSFHNILNDAFGEVERIHAPTEKDWDRVRSILPSSQELEVDRGIFDTVASNVPMNVWHLLVRSENTHVQRGFTEVPPLHYAIYAGISYEKIIAMIDAYPQAAAVVDSNNVTPLGCTLRCLFKNERIVSPKIIHRFLAAYPSAVKTFDDRGKTPLLGALFGFADNDFEHYENKNIYEIFSLLFKAAVRGTVEDLPSPFPTLHAAISNQSPWSLVQLIINVDPIQAQLYNEEGNLPIHVVAAIKPSHDGELLECFRCECEEIKRKRSVLGKINCIVHCGKCCFFPVGCKLMDPFEKNPAIIKDLIAANIKVLSVPNHDERLPLNIAILNDKSFECESVKSIFQAAPNSLSTRDIGTHMYSFMLSAVEYDKQTRRNKGDPTDKFLCKFTSCFSLLMENPVLVSSGIPRKGNKKNRMISLKHYCEGFLWFDLFGETSYKRK